MILYLDTSALLKLYVHEDRTPEVQQLADEAQGRASSSIAFVETISALARGRSSKRLTAEQHGVATQSFRRDWIEMTTVDLVPSVVNKAAELAETHLLRGMDAIHLASALTLLAGVKEPVTFLTFDGKLLTAARAEGLAIPTL